MGKIEGSRKKGKECGVLEDRTEGEGTQHWQHPIEHSSCLCQFTALMLAFPLDRLPGLQTVTEKSVVSIIHSTLCVQQSHSGFYKILAFSRDII